MIRSLGLFLTLALLTVALAGCHEPEMGSRFEYVADDFSFTGPDTLPAGWVEIVATNDGDDLHHIQLYRIADGHTAQEVVDALRAGGHPEFIEAVGGPIAPMPGAGGTTQAWIHLEAGPHIMLCEIPDRQGTPHVAHGMWQPVTVRGESDADEPTGETVTLSEFAFDGAIPDEAGTHTIKAQNAGAQPHELVVFRLQGNATAQELVQAFGPNATGPPPGAVLGGVAAIASGDNAYFTLDFTPGRYTFLCFVFDPASQAPHFALGMVSEFEI